jgi:Tol biopolymer transport system component
MRTVKSLSYLLVCIILVQSCASLQTVTKTPIIPDNAPGTTGNAKELMRISNDPIAEYYPRVSPDGKKVMFYTRDDNKTGSERFGLVYINIGQPGRTPIVGANTADGSWMADSKSFLYTYYRPAKPVICKGSIDGNNGISYITPSAMGEVDSYANLSPDGKKILFQSRIGSGNQLCLMDLNGNNFTVLTDGYYACWSPSGASFLYTKEVGKWQQIFTYDMKTGQSTQITSGEFHNFNATYSKDGKQIAFSSTRDNQSAHIFIMKADGSSLTQVTQGNTTNWYPAFGADNVIYFCSNAGAPKNKSSISTYSDLWSVKVVAQM